MVTLNKRLPRIRRDFVPLRTNCLLVGEGQRANIVFTTDAEFLALVERMQNGRDASEFVVGFRSASGEPIYKRAHKARAQSHGKWVLDDIRGESSKHVTMATYSRNDEGFSTWGAFDFDSHDGNEQRARTFALAAFNVLLPYRELRVVLCTSGESGGFHLLVFSDHFHSVKEWEKLLRGVARMIGASVVPGNCEILPRETRGRFGQALRIPGSYNPRDDSFGSIVFENIRPLLQLRDSSSLERKSLTSFNLGKETLSHEASGELGKECELGKEGLECEFGKEAPLFRGKNDRWRTNFAISAQDQRHDRLLQLVGEAFWQVCKEVARRNAELQYREASCPPVSSLEVHLSDFEAMWDGLDASWREKLTPRERRKYGALNIENHRTAFRVVRGWRSLHNPTDGDFAVSAEALGRQLGITVPGACYIRDRFCALGILRRTAPANWSQHKSARFKWVANSERAPQRNQREYLLHGSKGLSAR